MANATHEQQMQARLTVLELLVLELAGMHAKDREFMQGFERKTESFISASLNQPVEVPLLAPFQDHVKKIRESLADDVDSALPERWNTAVLFGLQRVDSALLQAVIETHPAPEKLRQKFANELERQVEEANNSGRPALEAAATRDYGKMLHDKLLQASKR